MARVTLTGNARFCASHANAMATFAALRDAEAWAREALEADPTLGGVTVTEEVELSVDGAALWEPFAAGRLTDSRGPLELEG
jgi:uncharacterized NAD(P)/FAD-binding protein YdhS